MAKKEAKKEVAPVEEAPVEEAPVEEAPVEEVKEVKEESKDSGLAEGEEYHERLGMKFIRNLKKGTMRRV